jgi:hypothetical protein
MPGLDDVVFNLEPLLSCPTEKIPLALAALSAAQAQLCARLLSASASARESASPGLVDAPELARQLDLPESWIRSRARSGRLPTVRAGRYYRFDVAAVRAAMVKS